ARVCRSLAPGGLLMVIEMDGLPTFLPDGAPGSRIEAHACETLLAAGWNSHPDWSRTLDLAGFDVIARRALNPDTRAATAEVARYAERHLGDVREALAATWPSDELTAFDGLLEPGHPESVARRDDLVARNPRTAWAARRPG
ncbi:MAG: hypothetical protein RI885_455, partial [Actinomycetota bacterium]